MGEEHWKQLVEEAEIAQTGDYVDLGVLWAKARIEALEKQIERGRWYEEEEMWRELGKWMTEESVPKEDK